MEKVKSCCICGKELKSHLEYNNPYPISKDDRDVCCGICNITFVVPERMKRLTNSRR